MTMRHSTTALTRHSTRVGLTLGDPSGIGPEICVKALDQLQPGERARVIVYGPASAFEAADEAFTAKRLANQVTRDVGVEGPFPTGLVAASSGRAAAQAVINAAEHCLTGELGALVTAPLHKEALALAGYHWPGHTELLADLAAEHLKRPVSVRMMLATPTLRVVLDSIHVPLRQAIQDLHSMHLLNTIRITHQTASAALGLAGPPRIGLAALNPHASENGRFGHEEAEILAPAVAAAQAEGIWVEGPKSADTIFFKAMGRQPADRRYDVVVCLYHDQGLIPIKRDGVDDGVNITLGLPYLRTSVDHGTAFDIAGRGIAAPDSLLMALRQALAATQPAEDNS